MSFPNAKELARVRKKLEKVETTQLLKKTASKADHLKFALCREFVLYLREHKMTQLELAKELDIDPARVSEIVKYKIDLFTADRLINLLEKLNPKLKLTVA
jgi:predicted XRE-type DNA-binding protein